MSSTVIATAAPIAAPSASVAPKASSRPKATSPLTMPRTAADGRVDRRVAARSPGARRRLPASMSTASECDGDVLGHPNHERQERARPRRSAASRSWNRLRARARRRRPAPTHTMSQPLLRPSQLMAPFSHWRTLPVAMREVLGGLLFEHVERVVDGHDAQELVGLVHDREWRAGRTCSSSRRRLPGRRRRAP